MPQDETPRADVCVITTIHPPFDARIYDRELKATVDAGFRVALVSPWEKPPQPSIEHGWVTLPPAKGRMGRLLHGFRTFRAAMRVKARAYHFHDLDFILWGVLLKTFKRVPVVYDCHENYPEEVLYNKPWIPASLRRPVAGLTRMVENWSVRRLKTTIVVVPNLVDRFTALGADATMVRNFAKFTSNRDLVHQKAVISTATLSSAYGVWVILDIARELKRRGEKLPVIVADRFSDSDIRKKFCELIKQENLDVTIVPKVLPKDMDKLLGLAEIGLSTDQDLPNMGLGYHAKLFEYMAMGMPIVASSVLSNSKLINESGSGLVVAPDDASAYVDAILKIQKDPRLFNQMRENGFEAIESRFSWKEEQKTLASLWVRLLGAPMDDSHRLGREQV